MTYERDAVTSTLRAQLRLVRGGSSVGPKRLVAAGRSGPAFGARGEVIYVVGRARGLLALPPEPPEAA